MHAKENYNCTADLASTKSEKSLTRHNHDAWHHLNMSRCYPLK